MTPKARIILVAAVLASVTAGLAWVTHRLPQDNQPPQGLREVTDMTSRRVSIPRRPARILSLCTSASDTIASMGEASRVVAIDEYSRVVPVLDHAAVIGKGSAISREHVLALNIDLAFVWWYQDDAAAMLKSLLVPVVRIRSGRADETPAMIRLVGECLGNQALADKAADEVDAFLRQARSQTVSANRPSVYLELYGAYRTVGRDSYTNDLLELAGGNNIARDATGSVLLSAEKFIQSDPDVILFVEGFGDAQTILSRPGMSSLRAAKTGAIHPIDRRWLIAGPHLPQAVSMLRNVITASSVERH